VRVKGPGGGGLRVRYALTTLCFDFCAFSFFGRFSYMKYETTACVQTFFRVNQEKQNIKGLGTQNNTFTLFFWPALDTWTLYFYLFIPFSCENIRFLSPKSIALLCLTFSTGEHVKRNVYIIYLATMDNSIWWVRVASPYNKWYSGSGKLGMLKYWMLYIFSLSVGYYKKTIMCRQKII